MTKSLAWPVWSSAMLLTLALVSPTYLLAAMTLPVNFEGANYYFLVLPLVSLVLAQIFVAEPARLLGCQSLKSFLAYRLHAPTMSVLVDLTAIAVAAMCAAAGVQTLNALLHALGVVNATKAWGVLAVLLIGVSQSNLCDDLRFRMTALCVFAVALAGFAIHVVLMSGVSDANLAWAMPSKLPDISAWAALLSAAFGFPLLFERMLNVVGVGEGRRVAMLSLVVGAALLSIASLLGSVLVLQVPAEMRHETPALNALLNYVVVVMQKRTAWASCFVWATLLVILLGVGALIRHIARRLVRLANAPQRALKSEPDSTFLWVAVIGVLLLHFAMRKLSPADIFLNAFALGATLLMPAMLLSLYWRHCTTQGVVAGYVAGLCVFALLMQVEAQSVSLWAAVKLDGQLHTPIFYSLPVSWAVTSLVSLRTIDRRARRRWLQLYIGRICGLSLEQRRHHEQQALG